jgi:IclR family pca regulon transcriptional regulator
VDQPSTCTNGRRKYCKPVIHAVSVLGCFSGERPVLGVKEIADALETTRPTAHRYLTTLVQCGYLEHAGSRRYRVAAGAADVALVWLDSSPLRTGAGRVLRELRERLGYTCSLAVLDGAEIVYLDCRRGCRRGQYAIDAGIGIGARLPAYATAAGKVLIASLPPGTRSEIIASLDLALRNPNVGITVAELEGELRQILKVGFATHEEQLAEGIRSIAAPVPDARGDIAAAIEVTAPARAISRDTLIESFSSPLRSGAMQVSVPAQGAPERHIRIPRPPTGHDPPPPSESWDTPTAHSEDSFSKAVGHGLSVLACFTSTRTELGTSDIASELSLSISGTRFHIHTLEAVGCLERATGTRYRLTPGVTRLGMSALGATILEVHARPDIQTLCEELGCTANLAVLDGHKILYLDRLHSIRGPHNTHNSPLALGSRLPVHCTATGKLLFAYLPRKEQERLLGELTLNPATAHTITCKHALRKDLEQIAINGIAISNEEFTDSQRAIAAPIHSSNNEVVAALSIPAHNSTLSLDGLREFAPRLITTANRISARLGYRPT